MSRLRRSVGKIWPESYKYFVPTGLKPYLEAPFECDDDSQNEKTKSRLRSIRRKPASASFSARQSYSRRNSVRSKSCANDYWPAAARQRQMLKRLSRDCASTAISMT